MEPRTIHWENLRIVFWNARGIKSQMTEIERIISKIDIFICVESLVKNNETIKIIGFKTIYKNIDNNIAGRGIIAFIRDGLNFLHNLEFACIPKRIELLSFKITNSTSEINFVVAYRIHGLSLTQTHWDDIVFKVRQLKNALWCGDFNSHNTAWGCKRNNTNGNRLYNALLGSDLCIHNCNTVSREDIARNTQSNIDLIISTADIANLIAVKVETNTFGSDHFPIDILFKTKRNEFRK